MKPFIALGPRVVDRMSVPATIRQRLPRSFEAVVIVVSLFLAVGIAYPILKMLYQAFLSAGQPSLGGFRDLLENQALRPALTNTIIILCISAPLAVAIGASFAWLNERTDAKMPWIGAAIPLVPLFLPPIVSSIGWEFLAEKTSGYINLALRAVLGPNLYDGNTGPLNIESWPGMIFLYTIYLAPYPYLIITNAIRNLDPALEEASRTSGAGKMRTLVSVTLGSIGPAIASSMLLVILIGSALFSFGRIVGTAAEIPILSVLLVNMTQTYPPAMHEAVALGTCMLAVLAGLWLVQRHYSFNKRHATISGRAAVGRRIPLGRAKWVLRGSMLTYMVVASLLPLLATVMVALQAYWSSRIAWSKMSLTNFVSAFEGPSLAATALQTSTMLGIIGASACVAVAAIISIHVHQRPSRWSTSLDGLTKAPGAIANTVMGVAFIVSFAGAPFNLAGSFAILLMAYVISNMPRAALTVGSGASQISGDLIEASAVSGASSSATFIRISVPLLAPSLAVAWALAFVTMLGDLELSVLLSGPATPVIGFVMVSIWDSGTFAQLAALGSILSFISAAVVLVGLAFGRRREVQQP